MAVKLYTAAELGRLLGVSAKTVRLSCKTGKLQAVALGGGDQKVVWRIPFDECRLRRMGRRNAECVEAQPGQ